MHAHRPFAAPVLGGLGGEHRRGVQEPERALGEQQECATAPQGGHHSADARLHREVIELGRVDVHSRLHQQVASQGLTELLGKPLREVPFDIHPPVLPLCGVRDVYCSLTLKTCAVRNSQYGRKRWVFKYSFKYSSSSVHPSRHSRSRSRAFAMGEVGGGLVHPPPPKRPNVGRIVLFAALFVMVSFASAAFLGCMVATFMVPMLAISCAPPTFAPLARAHVAPFTQARARLCRRVRMVPPSTA
mmetsp:Transcript_23414/g.73379  ORF Transcript_23414/g.73379 Transcript_23414/m.73379 type:complete len:244 (-) Transcript_23414:8-739(-)